MDTPAPSDRVLPRTRWGISARSAFVAAAVVFVALTLSGAGLAAVLHRTLLADVDSAAAERLAEIGSALRTGGVDRLDPGLLATDERILAVQILTTDGAVVRRSEAAPDSPLIPIGEIGDVVRIGMPEHASPFGPIRFSAGTYDGPGGRHTVLVGEGSHVVESTVRAVITALAVSAPIVIAVSAAATYLLVRRSMRSVEAIRGRVDAITTSDLTERVPVPDSRDEIAALAVTMNEMLSRIEAGHAAQQRFVGDASHELRSPLATIVSALEVAAAHPDLLGPLATETLLPEAHRMQALIEDLLLLARADERGLVLRREDVDLDDLVAAEVDAVAGRADPVVRADLAPVRLQGDRAALSRVVRNVLDNAARHAQNRVDVTVRADAGTAVLTVADDGPSVPPHERIRVFDRFVRLDPDRARTGGGAGLGLAIVKEIVTAHAGVVSFDGRPGGGSRLTVQLPLSAAPESSR
ncbi:ATP-binding protein [Mycobacterium sp. NPDC050041]|uniref:sensor histidine kinase n=1 Tax=Mycobacterium sp. NPDC050041 TaxID=3364293 RepID=UPI003C2B3A35